MFQPETEDMLPRMAPKPSADVPIGSTEGIVRPQVPEVSILFGQQELNNQKQHDFNKNMPLTNSAQPTYAAWKKQMLPKVTFPPNLVSEPKLQLQDNPSHNNMMAQNYIPSTTNLYPFRSIPMCPTMSTGVQFGNSEMPTTSNPIMYRRSLDSCNPQMDYSKPQIPLLQPLPQTLALPFKSNPADVLTICAGTQTDKALDMLNNEQIPGSVPWSNFVTRKDIEDVRQMLEELKYEQQRILKMLETFILTPTMQMSSKPQTCDVAVQIGFTEDHHPAFANAISPASLDQDSPQIAPTNKFIQHLKSSNNVQQTPKGKPIAQSTTYQPNSPQTQRLQGNAQEVPSTSNYQNISNKEPAAIARSASDTSLAMNELALKYLPSEKLVELLKELDMDDCPLEVVATSPNLPAAPIISPENKFEKRPSDISNASYKYLKKYRLLPEDYNEYDNANDEVENENHMPQYNSPQYNARNAPINQRHTPTNKNSPYTGRLPLSPLARASPPPQQIVNLENIKHQPKFL